MQCEGLQSLLLTIHWASIAVCEDSSQRSCVDLVGHRHVVLLLSYKQQELSAGL